MDLCPLMSVWKRAERLVRAVCPDVANLPLYLHPVSALPRDLVGDCQAYGFTAPTLDLVFREWLGDSWAGRGLFLAINDIALAEAIEGAGLDLEKVILGTCLHELAHVMGFLGTFSEPEPHAVLVDFHRLLLPSASARSYPVPGSRDYAVFVRQEWAVHDLKFIRAGVHLWFRAQALGFNLALLHVVGRRPMQTAAAMYARALGSEPATFSDLPIGAILTLPAPRDFVRLFQENMRSLDAFLDHEETNNIPA